MICNGLHGIGSKLELVKKLEKVKVK